MVKTFEERKAQIKKWRKNNPDKIKMYKERYKRWADLTDLPPPPHTLPNPNPKPKAEKKEPKPESPKPKSKSKYFGGNT